jgi:hypothetical protein
MGQPQVEPGGGKGDGSYNIRLSGDWGERQKLVQTFARFWVRSFQWRNCDVMVCTRGPVRADLMGFMVWIPYLGETKRSSIRDTDTRI